MKKVYIAVCGLPDSGKSTFIKNATKYFSGRDVNPDALCEEQKTGKTITNTKISCPCKHISMDYVFIDCPGHLEYYPEIISGLCMADGVVFIIDNERLVESEEYIMRIETEALKLGLPVFGRFRSHANPSGGLGYDGEKNLENCLIHFQDNVDTYSISSNLILFGEEENCPPKYFQIGRSGTFSLYYEGESYPTMSFLDSCLDHLSIQRAVRAFLKATNTKKPKEGKYFVVDEDNNKEPVGIYIFKDNGTFIEW